MRNKRIVIGATAGVLIAFLLFLFWPHGTRVVFYGRVLDDTGRPIAGAVVQGYIVRSGHSSAIPALFAPPNGGSRETLWIETDTVGRFIVSARGNTLCIERVSAKGFTEQDLNNTYFYEEAIPEPSRFRPDPNAPVTIRLRRAGKAE